MAEPPLPASKLRRWQIASILALATLFASLYMLTYSGRIISGDAQLLFDAAGSLAQHGDTLLDLSAGDGYPKVFRANQNLYNLDDIDAQSLQIYLSAPLYWLFNKLPRLGLVHGVWLFNIIISAAAVATLYSFTLLSGYRHRTALLAGLALGLGTILWPYSKSFFREPLALLTVLLVALALHYWRSRQYRPLWLAGVAAFLLLAALSTKSTNVFALPGLAVLALPSALSRRNFRRYVILATVLVALYALFLLFLGDLLGFREIYDRQWGRLDQTLRDARPFVGTALSGYLLSPGGSIWGTSPVVLLALPGLVMLFKQRQWRIMLASISVLATFTVGYALLRGAHWFGGLSWPPRFLIPALPFLIIAALPALERAALRPRSRWGLLAASALLYSFWVQLSAVSYWWGDFPALLPPEANGLIEWRSSLFAPRYLRWVLIPQQWGERALDFAWVRNAVVWWPLAFGVLALLSILVIWKLRDNTRLQRLAFALPFALAILIVGGLWAIRHDELYLGFDSDLHKLLPIIDEQTAQGDVLLVTSSHKPFFLNFGRTDGARALLLEPQPGERYSPDQPPKATSANPDLLVAKHTIGFLHNLASQQERLWLLASGGPFIPWSVRPEERFLTAHYYPIREFSSGPQARLIEYSTVSAPQLLALRGPDKLTDLRYGDDIQLVGFNLPLGVRYAPGDVLPISLYWQTDAPLDRDFTVAWFVRAADGAPVTQGMDSQPGGGFAQTSSWQSGVGLWDNRALYLPDNLAPGDYQIWVVLYFQEPGQPLTRLPVSGVNIVEGEIGVLPVRLEVG